MVVPLLYIVCYNTTVNKNIDKHKLVTAFIIRLTEVIVPVALYASYSSYFIKRRESYAKKQIEEKADINSSFCTDGSFLRYCRHDNGSHYRFACRLCIRRADESG